MKIFLLSIVLSLFGSISVFSNSTNISSDVDITLSVVVGDLNGDKQLDFIAGNQDQVNKMYLNNGTKEPFANVQGIAIGTDKQVNVGLALNDVDGDGDLDLIAAGYGPLTGAGDYNKLYLNNGKGEFSIGKNIGNVQRKTTSLAFADIDKDGDDDLITGNFGSPDQGAINYIYVNDGQGNFDNGTKLSDDSHCTYSLSISDIDKDGDLDLIVGNAYDFKDRLYFNDGKGNFTGKDLSPDFNNTMDMAVGDVNNDGHADIVTGNFASPDLLFINNGTNDPFNDVQAISLSQTNTNTSSIMLGDMDQDNNLDLIVGNFNDGVVGQANSIAFGDGKTNFSTQTFITTDAHITRGAALADMNKDGLLDIVTGNKNSCNKIYLNDGSLPQAIVVFTRMEVKPDNLTQTRRDLIDLVNKTRNEPGAISYNLYQGKANDKSTFVLHEIWRNQAAINTHVQSQIFADIFVKKIQPEVTDITITNTISPLETDYQLSNPINTVSLIKLKTSNRADFIEHARNIQEKGVSCTDCSNFYLQQGFPGLSPDSNFIFVESWSSKTEQEVFQQTDDYKKFVKDCSGLYRENIKTTAVELITPPSAISVVTVLSINPKEVDWVKNNLFEFVYKTRQETGCKKYDLYQSKENQKEIFVLHEQWKDQGAIDFHLSTPQFQNIYLKRVAPHQNGAIISQRISPSLSANDNNCVKTSITRMNTRSNDRYMLINDALRLRDEAMKTTGSGRFDVQQGFPNLSPDSTFVLFQQWDKFSTGQTFRESEFWNTFMSKHKPKCVALVETNELDLISIPEPIMVVTRMNFKTGSTEDIKTNLIELVDETRKENACKGYFLYQGMDDDKDIFVLHEYWEDAAAISYHVGTTHFKDIYEKKIAPHIKEISITKRISPFDMQTCYQDHLFTSLAFLEANNDDIQLITDASLELRDKTKQLVGYDNFDLQQGYPNLSPTNQFIFFQCWENASKFDTYINSKIWKDFDADNSPLLASKIQLTKLQLISSPSVLKGTIPGESLIQTISGVPYKFNWVPAGEFMMGSPKEEKDREDNESAYHKVKLTKGFWLTETEITQEQWQIVMGVNPSKNNTDIQNPVEQIAWLDITGENGYTDRVAKEMKLKDHYFLPSNAQWENACRAGTKTRYYWGDDLDYKMISDYAWYTDNGGKISHPVAKKMPNFWGFYDMGGNVYEWVSSYYQESYPDQEEIDPTGPKTGTNYIIRGGAFDAQHSQCRSAFHYGFASSFKSYRLGFRLALSPFKQIPVSIDDKDSHIAISCSSYPNPFSNNATITFEIDKRSLINLEIFDIQGNLIKKLVNNISYSDGKHFVVWNGSDNNHKMVSSGSYFVKLTNQNNTISTRLILAK